MVYTSWWFYNNYQLSLLLLFFQIIYDDKINISNVLGDGLIEKQHTIGLYYYAISI